MQYDPTQVSYEQLLETFSSIHNPTQLNRQVRCSNDSSSGSGGDRGSSCGGCGGRVGGAAAAAAALPVCLSVGLSCS